jgi:hypothetical protein
MWQHYLHIVGFWYDTVNIRILTEIRKLSEHYAVFKFLMYTYQNQEFRYFNEFQTKKNQSTSKSILRFPAFYTTNSKFDFTTEKLFFTIQHKKNITILQKK